MRSRISSKPIFAGCVGYFDRAYYGLHEYEYANICGRLNEGKPRFVDEVLNRWHVWREVMGKRATNNNSRFMSKTKYELPSYNLPDTTYRRHLYSGVVRIFWNTSKHFTTTTQLQHFISKYGAVVLSRWARFHGWIERGRCIPASVHGWIERRRGWQALS